MREQQAEIDCQTGLLFVKLKDAKINIERKREENNMRRRKNAVNKNQIRSSNERCENQFKVTQCHEMGEEEKEEEEERRKRIE